MLNVRAAVTVYQSLKTKKFLRLYKWFYDKIVALFFIKKVGAGDETIGK